MRYIFKTTMAAIAWVAIACPKARAQQVPVDSALLQRVEALENEVAEQKKGEDHFMVVGLTTFGYVYSHTVNTVGGVSQTTRTGTFGNADTYEFSPMLLWRHGTKFLLEFEPSFNNDGLSVNWADVSYFACPGLIVRAGYLVIPFGTYNKRLAAGWIDKLATDPIGIDQPPSTDYGVEIEGGLPMGNMKWSYDIALTNGMQLLPDGEIQSTGITDNNLNKMVTGRLALLPFSNSSLEIGVSGLFGKVGDAGSSFEGTRAAMTAVDVNYVKTFNPILVNVKAQYDLMNIGRQHFINPNDSTQTYTFDNTSTSGFAQLSLRPVSAGPVLKNVEVAFRYGNYTTPSNSLWGSRTDQFDVGLSYWISWRTVLKVTHESLVGKSTVNKEIGTDMGNTRTNSWFLQFSIQL
jgi:hypothetical protein